ncbi:MAG: hypothetical protein ACE5PM_07715 [Candidatus Hydrothermarchaeales archaeon]
MRDICARCKKPLKNDEPSVFHAFQIYHLRCYQGKPIQIVRK